MINARNIFCIRLHIYEKYTCSIYINYSSLNRCGLFDLYINTIGEGDISREVNSFPASLSSSLKHWVEGGGVQLPHKDRKSCKKYAHVVLNTV